MRADIQIVINEIEKSLSLLRQRLDWDNVKKKREEFDALTEILIFGMSRIKHKILCVNDKIL